MNFLVVFFITFEVFWANKKLHFLYTLYIYFFEANELQDVFDDDDDDDDDSGDGDDDDDDDDDII